MLAAVPEVVGACKALHRCHLSPQTPWQLDILLRPSRQLMILKRIGLLGQGRDCEVHRGRGPGWGGGSAGRSLQVRYNVKS